jgi:hypothetical protein
LIIVKILNTVPDDPSDKIDKFFKRYPNFYKLATQKQKDIFKKEKFSEIKSWGFLYIQKIMFIFNLKMGLLIYI